MWHPDSEYPGHRWWDDHELSVGRPTGTVHFRVESGSALCEGISKQRSPRKQKVTCRACLAILDKGAKH